jgi:RNA polymerase sigma factor for flagellar operon FliA
VADVLTLGRAMSDHDDGVADLWRGYKSTGDLALRNRLVIQYSPLVKYVAGRVRSGLPQSVDQADLISEGVIGLIDAIDKFEPARGLQFQTYAVPRIRGAMVDSLRASDWVPRSLREKKRDLDQARTTLEARLARTPTDDEVAVELGVSVSDLREICRKVSYTSVASFDELGGGDDLAPSTTDGPIDSDLGPELLDAVGQLPERDQIIVALYYFEALTLAEIGLVLGVTESRVSQLHTKVTKALKANLTLAGH